MLLSMKKSAAANEKAGGEVDRTQPYEMEKERAKALGNDIGRRGVGEHSSQRKKRQRR